MIVEENIYRFLQKEEIMEIIKKIDNIEDDDIRARIYLLTLGYKSIDIQKFTIAEGEELSNNVALPKSIRQTLSNSVNKRKEKIQKYKLDNDIEYLFVNEFNKNIHDCILLRNWRNFLKENNIDDINIQVFRQSINFYRNFKKYEKYKSMNLDKKKEELEYE